MSESVKTEAFTPGPWQFFRASKVSNFTGYVARVSGPDAATVARVYAGNSSEREPAEANARLISAAPDLIDFARGVVALADLVGREDMLRGLDVLIELAQAAIQKAEGR